VQGVQLAWGVLVGLAAIVGCRLVVVGMQLVTVVPGADWHLVPSQEPLVKCINAPPQPGSSFM